MNVEISIRIATY